MHKTTLIDGIYLIDGLSNYTQVENTSICQFLYFLDINDIARRIEQKYYTESKEYLRYPVDAMLKLCIVKQFHKTSYKKVVASLTQEDAWLLGFDPDEKTGLYKVPSGSTLHDFIRYRLKEDGVNEIMLQVGKKLVQSAASNHAKTDSTPLEASRYDKYADYNPHYQCNMYKAHITLIGPLPIYMNFTRGNAGDSPELFEHIHVLKCFGAKIDEYLLDGGYDSFENHADIWYHLGAVPRIKFREDAVINPEGTLERIDHWVNKKWKEGGNIHRPLKDKLRFLYENGKQENTGAYFRNQNLQDEDFDDSYNRRSECERVNDYIKDTVKFNVKGTPNDSKELYTKLSFVAYQLMILTNVQNGIEPVNSFGRYY